MDGLNRYGYVHGNPTTRTDPTGHFASCLGLIAHPSATSNAQVAASLGCVTDVAYGGADVTVNVMVATKVVNQLTQVRTSGTSQFLSKSGNRAVKAGLSSTAIINKLAQSRPWKGVSIPDEVVGTASKIVNNPANLRKAVRNPGTRAARNLTNFKTNTLGKAGKLLGATRLVGRAVGVIGFGLTAWGAGSDYYSRHSGDIAGAIGVGVFTGALSVAGAWAGGTAGAIVGTAICGGLPVCGVAGAWIGSAVGAYAGEALAGGIVNFFESGTASKVASGVSNFAQGLASGPKGWFGL